MIFSPSYLILMLTDACNLNCAYCYLGKNKSSRVMDKRIIDRSIALALKSGTPFHLQLSGGEPTLVPGLVQYAANKMRKETPHSTIGIQTNATRIDKHMTTLMARYNLDVGISLDGTPDIQEKLRGKASETFRGLQLLEEEGIHFNITTVVTRDNADDLYRLLLLLGGFSRAGGIGLDLLVHKGNARKNQSPEPVQLKKGLEKMMKALETVNQMRNTPLQFRELARLKNQNRQNENTLFCHAAAGKSLAVTPDGHLYPCTQTAFDPVFSLGTLEHPDFPKAATALSIPGPHPPENNFSCNTCPLETKCPGDCPGRTYYNRFKNPHLACIMYRAILNHEISHSQGNHP